jgi:hypothetical protein
MEKQAYEITKYFTEECGIRIAGKDEVLKAVKYIEKFYQENEIKSFTHEFNVPVCDEIKSQLSAKIGDQWIPLNHTPVLFSQGTSVKGITAPLVYVENGATGFLDEIDIKDKMVLISRDVYFEYPDIDMYKKLEKYGPAGIIYTTVEGHRGIPYVYANFETMDDSYTIPTAVLHFDDAIKLLKNDNVLIHYSAQFDYKESKSKNIIGIVEAENPDAENVVICAHIDSSMGSAGAADDAAGVALVMVLAKHYAQLAREGKMPKRNMLFATWSGHESGIHGSKYFLKDNPEIFDKVRFTLNYDVVGTTLSLPQIIGGFNDEVGGQLRNLIEELQYEWPLLTGPMVVDALNFAVKGIPHITFTSGIFRFNHTLGDNMDLISPKGFTSPIHFSKKVLDWAISVPQISQGFSEELTDALKACAFRYGWGLYEE